MSFFDDLGKKISQTGQSAVQKTRNKADSARLNALLTEEEKRLGNCYYQLGRLYCSLHADDCEPPFAELIAAIRDREAKTEALRNQIRLLKGVVLCENCGGENPEHASFCCKCGKPRPKPLPETEERVVCGYCGARVRKQNFCTACGKPLPQETAEPAAPARPAQEPSPPQVPAPADAPEPPAAAADAPEAPPPTVTCPRWGTQMEASRFFCSACGAILKDATAENAAAASETPGAEAPVCPDGGEPPEA